MPSLFKRLPQLLSAFSRQSFSTRPQIMWVHTATEILTALAFYMMALGLIYFLYKRKDLKWRWGFLLVLAAFFFGVVHTVHLLAPWYPVYSLELFLKFAAAFCAITAVVFIRGFIPRALEIPHPEETKKKIQKLSEEAECAKQNENVLRESQQKFKSFHEEEIRKFVRVKEQFENQLDQSKKDIEIFPLLIQSLGETGDFETGLEKALRVICEKMEWDYAEVWIGAENGKNGKVLECGPVWYGKGEFEPVRQISRDLKFPVGMGLAGRVWASKKHEVIADLPSAPNGTFFQVEVCRKVGLHAAVAIPVLLENKVLAVLVFLLREFREEDKRRAALIAAASGQLGCLLAQKAAEKALQEGQELLERRIRERTKELFKSKEALEAQVAEHQSNEEFLRRSQENFSTLLNSLDGIVWEFKLRESKFSFVSEQAERMLGYPLESWFSEPTFWQDHIHGGDRGQAVAFRAKVAQDKKGDRFEYRMITSDGRTLWLRDMVTVVVENDEAVKLRGVMVNITEPRQVAEALDQEKSFVSAVFETASALVMVLDTDGRVVRFNRACEQTSGYTAEEAKGKYFWDLFSVPEEITKNKNIFSRLLAGQFPINEESYWVAKDESRRAIAWSNTVLLNRSGAVVNVIATGVDITKRKEVEQKLKEAVADLAHTNQELDKSSQELKEANQRLREMDEIKSHFISAASHELRTPLTSIKGYVESILEDEVGPLNEKQREFLGYVKTSTDRLHRLLNELLDISKIESGQVKMRKEQTNMKDLLREEVMVFKAQAANKNITLNFESEMHLREIYCDADKIKEVMDNLLSNAIKYTAKGGRVTLEAKNDQTGIQIEVHDTGIGIRKEDLGRIFEPFQHIEKSGMEDEESTGLGLTLVRRIVEAHEGNITVKSQEGKGSTFTVTLPLSRHSEEANHASDILSFHE